ncbi:copper-translocating P-type ATPase [Xylocopilactobacillus apicola]|uniref:P-type Cu(+) transporter n=1 Tax=Xylocopilactobacillus apicola TaxID=2932184 RepID=A0AAU9DQ47_9LACO|nr:copper-translocating P-type ATPase [Xylocopilactobacillus apicola]BDR57979.1 copper-translocating P-type ATPase [Xylocopilactobacillus apicola]
MSIKSRFIFSLIATIPMLINMVGMPFGWMLPGGDWLSLVLTTAIMLVSARPFLHSAWAAFKNHHANMDTLVAIGTVVAYLYSIYAMINHQGVFFESAAFIITFVLLGQVLEEKMRHNASSAVEKLLDLQAKFATVVRAGQFVKVPLAEVQTGDIIQVKPGQKIAVDGVITEGSTTIDESMVTGESMPVTKNVGDRVIGATINKNGTFLFRAEKVGSETMLAQIVETVKKAQTSRAPIQKTTDQVSNIFVPIVLILAIITFVAWYVVIGSPLERAMMFAVSVVVIACPCALGLATPTALMVGTGRSAKMGVLIKNGEVLEAADNIKTVVFDKTGTITNGKPEVTDIIGSTQEVLSLASALEADSEHPLADAIMQKAQEMKIKSQAVTDFQAIAGEGVIGHVNGEMVKVGNEKLFSDQSLDSEIQNQMKKLQDEAKTVVIVGTEAKVKGLIAIQDAPKPSSARAIKALKKQGLKTVMLTGDHQRVANAIAKQVGIDQVLADVMPEDKAKKVQELEQDGPVAFVGDGINDAPALTIANVGIAMGAGTDIAIESGGIVLVKNDLWGVVEALELSKKTFNRIKLNLFWAFIYNAIGIPIAAGFFVGIGLTLSPELAGLAMALSSISVVSSSLMLNRTKIISEI